MRTTSRECKRECGFTLIELLVVLTIVGLLLAAAPAILTSARPSIDAQAAAQALADNLRAVRNAAITSGRETRLRVDLTHASYAVSSTGRRVAIPPGVAMRLRTARGDITAEMADIRFFPDGTSTGAQIWLSNGGQEHRVLVYWISGRVSVDE